MGFEKRFLLLLVIVVYGIAYVYNFLTNWISETLSVVPDWNMILFVSGLADIDNLYLIICTIPWSLFCTFVWYSHSRSVHIT